MIKKYLMGIFDNDILTILIIALGIMIYAWSEVDNVIVIKFFCFWTTIYAALCYLKLSELEKEIRRGKVDSIILEKKFRRQG